MIFLLLIVAVIFLPLIWMMAFGCAGASEEIRRERCIKIEKFLKKGGKDGKQ